MASDLATYLQDHLAGATAAIEVIASLQKHSQEPVLTALLAWLLPEVQRDKQTLERLSHNVATGPSTVKESAAWIGSLLIHLKTKSGKSPFGAFEGLEFLCLGIQGKLHLWKALSQSSTCSKMLTKREIALLIERAETQHREVEQLRLAIATIAL